MTPDFPPVYFTVWELSDILQGLSPQPMPGDAIFSSFTGGVLGA